MSQRVLLYLFAATMGFFVGGSFAWGIRPCVVDQTYIQNQSNYETCPAFLEWIAGSLLTAANISAFGAIAVAVFTWLLWDSTHKLWQASRTQASLARVHAARQSADMRESIAATTKAAEAAMLSARAAIGIELPFLRIEPDRFSFGSSRISDDETRHYFVVSLLRVSNVGRTRAVPIEIRCGWTFGNELPEQPIYRWSTGFKVDVVIEPHPANPVEFIVSDLEMDAPADAYTQLVKRKTNFWIYVCFVYLDFMNTRHEDCFCWRRTEGFGVGQFITDDAPAYNRKS